MEIYISADIGGSHITSAAINSNTKQIIAGSVSELDVNNKASASEIISEWASCMKKTIDKAGGIKGIGIAMPGPFDYFYGISKIKGVKKFDNLFNVNIRVELSKVLNIDNKPIRFINDATAFAVGEAWAGKVSEYKKVLAITLGTGFGSAFLDDKIPVLEGKTVPKYGCVYHLPFKEGIADDYFSTRWFVSSYNDITGMKVRGVKEIARHAQNNDPDALRLFEIFGNNLGEFLSTWIRKFNAEAVVIGGNISNAGDLFIPQMKASMLKHKLQPTIKVSDLKEEAALLGAAHLVDDAFYKKVEPLLKLM